MEEPTDNRLLEMPFLRNVGLIVTYKCQVACPHCIIEAGPHRKEEMRLEDALEWIQQVAAYRDGYVQVLSLTGGEPFYNLELLKDVSCFAQSCGLLVSAVTNAYWAPTRQEADRLLAELDAIKMLSISTDVYHQENIPFEWVKNAIEATQARGLPYTVAVCTENDQDAAYLEILDRLYEITPRATVLPAVTFPAGRALKRAGEARYQMTPEPPPSACPAGSSPIVFPDGRVIACIGSVIDLSTPHPLVLGNLRESPLYEILDRAETNAILHAVRVWGPQYLIARVQEAGLGNRLPTAYIRGSICNACYSLMADAEIVAYLDQLAKDPTFLRTIAYARVYYLHETRMVELLGLRG
jgi:organic radical activating enzyme